MGEEGMSVVSPESRRLMREAKLGARHWRALRPDVETIRKLAALGMSQGEVAGKTRVKRGMVGAVLRGEHWSVRA